jgi:hypothetical protein
MLFEMGARAVFWLDADALIVGDRHLAGPLLCGDGQMTMCRHPGPPEHWNCGVWFVRNTARVRDLLREVLAQGPGEYPWYQQQILNDLLNLPAWWGLVVQMDDCWNSTFRFTEVEEPQIVAWHGWPGGPRARAEQMRRYLEDHRHGW